MMKYESLAPHIGNKARMLSLLLFSLVLEFLNSQMDKL